MKKVQLERVEKFIAPYRVTRGKGFRLKNIDPGDTAHLKSEDKAEAKEMLARGVEWLTEQQDMLYAQDHWVGVAEGTPVVGPDKRKALAAARRSLQAE